MKYPTVHIAALSLLFGACASATAGASESPVYDYVSGYYQLVDFDETETGINAEPDGFGLEFSKQINDFMYVIASYDDISGDYEIGNFIFSADTSVLMAVSASNTAHQTCPMCFLSPLSCTWTRTSTVTPKMTQDLAPKSASPMFSTPLST